MTELYVPGRWLPINGGTLRCKGYGHTGVVDLPCPKEAMDRVVDAFVDTDRQGMSVGSIETAIRGDEGSLEELLR